MKNIQKIVTSASYISLNLFYNIPSLQGADRFLILTSAIENGLSQYICKAQAKIRLDLDLFIIITENDIVLDATMLEATGYIRFSL